ncbi:pantoate--beta-alanine ligase [Clostridium sporogenes]|nr:pantoate--beta-alanine ligase [Clostridium sporogenes]
MINKEPLTKIDYVNIVDSANLQPVEEIQSSILIAIAVYIGKTRLIDNFTFAK